MQLGGRVFFFFVILVIPYIAVDPHEIVVENRAWRYSVPISRGVKNVLRARQIRQQSLLADNVVGGDVIVSRLPAQQVGKNDVWRYRDYTLLGRRSL